MRAAWRRFSRRTLAPRRPLLYEHQYGLALVTGLVLIASIVAVVIVLTR